MLSIFNSIPYEYRQDILEAEGKAKAADEEDL